MILSDALPIQFWDEEEETFNDKEVCGIEPVCFCQPFNCFDEILIQFTDHSYPAYNLYIYSVDGIILKIIEFTEISDNIWWLSFIPDQENSPGICEKIILKIVGDYDLPYNRFLNSLGNWYNVETGLFLPSLAWTYSAESAEVVMDRSANNPINSKYLTVMWDTFEFQIYNITLDFNIDLIQYGVSFLAQLKVFFSNGSNRDLAFVYDFNHNLSQEGNHIVTRQFTAQHNYDRIEVYVFLVGGGVPAPLITIRLNEILVGNDIVKFLKKSDCIYIKDSHECTELITYSNSKLFNGIDYSSSSPEQQFCIRIPAIFFEEAFPDEHEEIDLSNSQSVRLMNKEKRQKKLDIGFMPFYMHQKMKLILAHDEITIDGDSWIRNEAYEITEGNKRYPLRKASCLLTDKNYIVRNVL